MDDREMTRLWGAVADPSTRNEEEILVHVIRRARRFDRKLLVRDAVEAGAGLLVVVVMGRASWLAPGWLPKLGALAILAAVAYVVVRLLAARRRGGGAPADLPLAERLRREIAKVQAQVDLLRTVRRWYVLPLAAGATAWMATLVPPIGLPPALTAAGVILAVAASAGIFTAVGWAVERLNRAAVETNLLPYRQELEALLAEAEAEPAA